MAFSCYYYSHSLEGLFKFKIIFRLLITSINPPEKRLFFIEIPFFNAKATVDKIGIMNLNKVKNNFERLFDKNLTDLVRGIRNNKNNETKFISQCIEEIKDELKIPNVNAKANAVAKLTYLQMLGYDISWAAFNIIEVMSSERFTHKRIGYLAASQCFSNNTEVLMLTINMIRRDLCSRNIYETGCAMSGMSCFVSNEIGRELFNDVNRLFSSTKPYLRKKAVLLMYKILTVFPDTIPEVLPKLEEKLEDPDQGVQSSVINVICELVRKNPKDFLNLEGVLYKLMENSSNNWMLIKIIKLFGALTPIEPRMGEKIIVPLENLAHDTSAMSVLYETISTMMAILASPSCKIPKSRASAYRQLCVQKLRIFIEDSDQNLKYLGLLAMKKMLDIHSKSVRSHQDVILACLEDKDESIRLRALDLLYGMVSKDNLSTPEGDGIVDRLMKHVSYPKMGNKFRDEIVYKVIDICSRNDYFYISNFDWYVTVLVTLASIEAGTSHGNLIASQILDVALRVKEVRPYAVKQMAAILKHTDKFSTTFSVSEVLYAAAWICGEYSEYLNDKSETMYNLLAATNFEPYIIAIFVHNACKIFSRIAQVYLITTINQDTDGLDDDANNNCKDEAVNDNKHQQLHVICDRLVGKDLKELKRFDDLEVQERVSNFINIIDATKRDNIDFCKTFYAYTLNPVTTQAQAKVPIPEGLDLDTSLVFDPDSPLSTDDDDSEDDDLSDSDKNRPHEADYEDKMSQVEAHFNEVLDIKSSPNKTVDEPHSYTRTRHHDIHYLSCYNAGSVADTEDDDTKHIDENYDDQESSRVASTKNNLPNGASSRLINDNHESIEPGIEAIVVAQRNVRDFKSIPGLTSYSDFMKNEKKKSDSKPTNSTSTKSTKSSKTKTIRKKTKKEDVTVPKVQELSTSNATMNKSSKPTTKTNSTTTAKKSTKPKPKSKALTSKPE